MGFMAWPRTFAKGNRTWLKGLKSREDQKHNGYECLFILLPSDNNMVPFFLAPCVFNTSLIVCLFRAASEHQLRFCGGV